MFFWRRIRNTYKTQQCDFFIVEILISIKIKHPISFIYIVLILLEIQNGGGIDPERQISQERLLKRDGGARRTFKAVNSAELVLLPVLSFKESRVVAYTQYLLVYSVK